MGKQRLLIDSPIVNYSPHTFYGSISNCIPHACIHFDTYTSKQIRDIIHLPRTKRLITIKKINDNQNNHYNSMMETILSIMQSYTNDIMDIIQIAQYLWPHYLQLVNNTNNQNYRSTLMIWIKRYLEDNNSFLISNIVTAATTTT